MSQLHRIQWIDHQIKNKNFPNSTKIAKEFCISQRQALRDIEYLRYSLNAPLEYSYREKGYFYTDKRFTIPGVMIKESEKKALAYLIEQYKTQNSGIAKDLADLFSNMINEKQENPEEKKLNSKLNTIHYPLQEKEVTLFLHLKKAIGSQKKCEIIYEDYHLQKTKRIIHPYHLFIKYKKNYLVCFCELRNNIRTLKLARIRKINTLNNSFEIPMYLDLSRYNKDYRFHFRHPYQTIIQFNHQEINSWVFKTFPNQIVKKDNGTYTIEFYRSIDFISKLLGCSEPFKIIFPKWLKKKIQNRISKILEKNL